MARLSRVDGVRIAAALATAVLAGGGAMWAGEVELVTERMGLGALGGIALVALACAVTPGGLGMFRLRRRWRTPVSASAPALALFRDASVLAAGLLVALAVGGLAALAAASLVGARADGTRFEGWVAVGQRLFGAGVALLLGLLLLSLRARLARWRVQGRVDGQVVIDSFEAAASLLVLLGAAALLVLLLLALPGSIGTVVLEASAGAWLVLLFAAFLAPPIYLLVRAAGNAWVRGPAAAASTLWIVIPRADAAAQAALDRWLLPERAGPVVVVVPPQARMGGELLLIAERLRLRTALFPRNAGQLDDWLELLPAGERWWGLPIREWHPPAALLREAVARHLKPEDALVLITADADEALAWQDLARNRVHALQWLGTGARPASAFDDADPVPLSAPAVTGPASASEAAAASPGAEAPAPAIPPAPAAAPPPAAPAPSPPPAPPPAAAGEPLPARRARLEAALQALDARGVDADAAERIEIEAELGQVLYDQGWLDRARVLQEHVLAFRERTAPAGDRSLDRAQVALLETQFELGAYAQALDLAERALATRTRLLGPQHPDSLHTLDNRSAALWGVGRYEEARRDSEAALAGRTAVLGANHHDTLETEGNLIQILLALGLTEEALARRHQQLERCTAALGPGDAITLTALSNLGLLQLQLGRVDEARATFARCLDARRLVLGPEHPHTLQSQRDLGIALRALGQQDEGDRLVRLAWQTASRAHGSQSVVALDLEAALGPGQGAEQDGALAAVPASEQAAPAEPSSDSSSDPSAVSSAVSSVESSVESPVKPPVQSPVEAPVESLAEAPAEAPVEPPTEALPPGTADAGAGADSADSAAPADTAHVAAADVTGTTWAGTDSDGDDYQFHFLPDGTLHYQSPTGFWKNGTWRQDGAAIYLEMNDKFSEYEGRIADTRMQGTARNRQGRTWTWAVDRT